MPAVTTTVTTTTSTTTTTVQAGAAGSVVPVAQGILSDATDLFPKAEAAGTNPFQKGRQRVVYRVARTAEGRRRRPRGRRTRIAQTGSIVA